MINELLTALMAAPPEPASAPLEDLEAWAAQRQRIVDRVSEVRLSELDQPDRARLRSVLEGVMARDREVLVALATRRAGLAAGLAEVPKARAVARAYGAAGGTEEPETRRAV